MKSRGKEATTPRGVESRSQIIALATAAFAEQGYQAASLRDIAASVGMTAASFYYHFGSKEELLRHIIVDSMDRLSEVLMRELATNGTLAERFSRIVRDHIIFTYENSGQSKIIADESRYLSPGRFETIRDKQVSILNIYRNLISGLQQEGLAHEGDVNLAAFLVLSTINGFVRWFRPGRRSDFDDAVRATVEYASRGIGLRS